MILLTATTHILELVTSSTAGIDYVVSYADHTSTTFDPGSSQGTINSATTTTILSAPAASTQRQVKQITIVNRGTAVNNVRLAKDISGTEYRLTPTIPLYSGEALTYNDSNGFTVLNAYGMPKGELRPQGLSSYTSPYMKVGTAAEAATRYYSYSKDAGWLTGAWSPGSPGVNGRTTDGTTAADAGCIPFVNASSGNMYLTGMRVWANSTTHYNYSVVDYLWVNTGLSVTTTTAQAITSGTLPARDIKGQTNGDGVYAGILVTTATTNAGTTTPTISYTNSAGTSGRTGTISNSTFPATAVIGTFTPFILQAGDVGIRSIESITLGTSLVTGAISLVMYRHVSGFNINSATIGTTTQFLSPGIRCYNGSCLHVHAFASTTGSTTVTAEFDFNEY